MYKIERNEKKRNGKYAKAYSDSAYNGCACVGKKKCKRRQGREENKNEIACNFRLDQTG